MVMASIIVGIVLLLIALIGSVLRKTYYHVPESELKRRAAAREPLAEKLYPVVAHGGSLRVLLWLLISGTSAAGLVLLIRAIPLWVSLLLVILLLPALHAWLIVSRFSHFDTRLTLLLNPLIAGVLQRLHPLLLRVARPFEGRSERRHTGLYEPADLLALLEQQQQQSDNRISPEQVEIIRRALDFGNHRLHDILTPLEQVRIVSVGDTVGPVLIDELHASQQDFALVRDKADGSFAGSLTIKKLGLHSQGKVRDNMEPNVYYLHENDSLSIALHAFFATNHPFFVALDNREESVGIVTMANVLKQLLGHVPGEDFDEYTTPAAVVTRHQSKKSGTSGKTDASVIE